MILFAAMTFRMELLILFFPLFVVIGVVVGASGRSSKLLGALAGAISGFVGMAIPTTVWAYEPLESGVVNQYNIPIQTVVLTCATLGGIAGAIIGALYGAYVDRRRQRESGITRDWPMIAIITLAATWTLLLLAISSDPWIYFNGYREDYIAFESRIYMSFVFGTPIAIIIFGPVVLIAAAVYSFLKSPETDANECQE